MSPRSSKKLSNTEQKKKNNEMFYENIYKLQNEHDKRRQEFSNLITLIKANKKLSKMDKETIIFKHNLNNIEKEYEKVHREYDKHMEKFSKLKIFNAQTNAKYQKKFNALEVKARKEQKKWFNLVSKQSAKENAAFKRKANSGFNTPKKPRRPPWNKNNNQ